MTLVSPGLGIVITKFGSEPETFLDLIGKSLGKGGVESGVPGANTFAVVEEFDAGGGAKLVVDVVGQVVDKAVPVGPFVIQDIGGSITVGYGSLEIVGEGLHHIECVIPVVIEVMAVKDLKYIITGEYR